MLDARLCRRHGALDLEAELQLPPGGTLVLAGGSGAGKTSVLRLLAGLDPLDEGHILVDGQRWADTARSIHRAANERSVGWVPQEASLFPHLNARDNVAFGLSRDRRRRADELLERCGAGGLAGREIAGLSGGERQRIALARALAVGPALLLLDEPLSALDPENRTALRSTLAAIIAERQGVTLLVTHSPLEALALGSRIAVMERGKVVQHGTGDELLLRPRSHSVAAFLGANFFRGVIVSRPESGLAELDAGDGRLTVVDPGGASDVFAVVPPTAIVLSRAAPEGSARNIFRGEVTELAPEPPHGERIRVALATAPRLVAEVTPAGAQALGLAPGAVVFASFKATAVRAYR